MKLHNHVLFKTRDAIPDLVVPELLLSSERTHLLVPKAIQHSSATTTPVEVAYCFYELGAGSFEAERQLLDIYQQVGGTPDDFLEDNWGRHLGRAMLKAMLDPDRQAPIDMVEAYRSECKSRFASPNEEAFFVGFVDNWSVLEHQ